MQQQYPGQQILPHGMISYQAPVETPKSILRSHLEKIGTGKKNVGSKAALQNVLQTILRASFGGSIAKIFPTVAKNEFVLPMSGKIIFYSYRSIPHSLDEISQVIASSRQHSVHQTENGYYVGYSFGDTMATLTRKYSKNGGQQDVTHFIEALFELFIEELGMGGKLDNSVVASITAQGQQQNQMQLPFTASSHPFQQQNQMQLPFAPSNPQQNQMQLPFAPSNPQQNQMQSSNPQQNQIPFPFTSSNPQQNQIPFPFTSSNPQQNQMQLPFAASNPQQNQMQSSNPQQNQIPFPFTSSNPQQNQTTQHLKNPKEENKNIYDYFDEIKTLDEFRPYMKNIPCFVRKVIDGDTFDVAVLEPVSSYEECRRHTAKGKIDDSPMCKLNGAKGEVLKVLRVRGQNYDAAEYHIKGKKGKKVSDLNDDSDDEEDHGSPELTTKEGWLAYLIARKFFEDVQSKKGKLTVDFHGLGQYQRYQGSIKLNGVDFGESLSKISLEQNPIARWGYNGKKKSDFSNNLQKFPLKDLLEDIIVSQEMEKIAEEKYDEFIKLFGDYPKYDDVSSLVLDMGSLKIDQQNFPLGQSNQMPVPSLGQPNQIPVPPLGQPNQQSNLFQPNQPNFPSLGQPNQPNFPSLGQPNQPNFPSLGQPNQPTQQSNLFQSNQPNFPSLGQTNFPSLGQPNQPTQLSNLFQSNQLSNPFGAPTAFVMPGLQPTIPVVNTMPRIDDDDSSTNSSNSVDGDDTFKEKSYDQEPSDDEQSM